MTTQPEQIKSEVVLDEDKLRRLLSNEDIHSFRQKYLVLHPYDRAIFYEEVGAQLRELMYFYLSPKELAEIFETSEIEEDEYEEFLEEMDATYAAEMISYMFVDNAVDVLKELDKKK